ncbi:class A beta-lactamase [Streptomyces sp. NPDC055955]|uniref:class A beta-lactamase n=2 Tax=Streptomyces TaxID=1883 RepID=UPI0035D6F793
MSFKHSGPSRRLLLAGAALMSLAGCGTGDHAAPRSSPDPNPDRVTGPPSRRRPDSAMDNTWFATLERKHGARLGVYALATGTGTAMTYRADERFAFCSTFKALAVAAVLHRNPPSHLAKQVTYTKADVDSISPITKDHVTTGMTIRQLCDAAIRYSDGTAGNLLVRDLGGTSQFNAFLRGLGDDVTRLDDYEPQLNRHDLQDPRDTSTPRALAHDYHALVLGDALTRDRRALLTDWLERTATSAGTTRIRAGLPKGWTVAHKTGTGDYGRANDIAIVWPPHAAPLVLSLMSDRTGYSTPPVDALIAEATRHIVTEFT